MVKYDRINVTMPRDTAATRGGDQKEGRGPVI